MAPADLIGAALAVASGRQLTRALQVLIRASEGRDAFARAAREALDRHLPELVERAAGADDDGGELPEALSLAVTLIQPGTGAIAAADSLPAATGPLAGLATQVLLIATVALEKTAAGGGNELLEERARAHSRLAALFTEQGERRWTAAASRRVVEIRRLLVERDGDEHIEGLATALNNLSVTLAEPGQAEESLRASEEAVAMFRRLAEAGPEAYLPSLANALANLSVSLAGVGHDDEALAAVQEAAGALAEAGTDEKRAERARVLHILSVRLAALGRHAEAVEAIGEAVRIRRDLAAPGLDRFRADLASSLDGYSVRLGAVGRQAEALAAIEEAVRIGRDLAVADPGRYLPPLATSLNNLSVDLNRAGRPVEDALAATAEAVRIRRDLARAEPGRSRPGLAAALHNMSADLAASGQYDQALDAIKEAVEIRRELAAARPHLYAPLLAGSLRDLSIRLAADGRPAEAADAAEESAGIFRSLAGRQPGRFRPELATSLSTLSIRLGAVGRHREALAADEECVELLRALAATAPNAYLPELAASLNDLSVSLSRAGQPRQALAAAEETVRIRRDLAAAHPGLYTAGLANSLNTLGVGLGDAGRHSEALAVFQEAVRLLRPPTASDPQAALPDLVMSLGNLCEQLTALGRNAEAEELFTQLLAGYSVDSRARGIILLGRGHWSAWDGNITATITDARDALDLLPADAPARAKARRLLRGLRRQDPGRFDLAWDDSRGDQPTWLRHLDVDRLLTDQIDRLVAASTMEEEEALLAANPRLVSEEAEAVLDRLIDDNPGHRWLLMHRDILRVARAGGVEDAYARHRKLLWREGTAKALGTWFSAAREGLRDVMTAERVLLLSDEAVSQVDSMLATTARTPELIWRAGLLALCRSDGEEAAFQISADPGALRRPPGSRALNAFEPRDLALARLRAGFDPDDPEAIFVHAVLALAAGLADEADEAIGRCAEESTSWDRRAAAVHLTELTAIHPDLAAGLARLRSILAASESGKHSR